MMEVNKILSETSGAGFYITANETEWTLNITKNQTVFKGSLSEVLEKYLEEINTYRFEKKNKVKKNFSYQ